MHILTIFQRYGTERYPGAEAALDALFAAQLPGVRRTVVVVDSALPPGHVERDGARTVIGSSNDDWEFSSFDAAIAHIGDALWDADLVNLATSAFQQLYADYLRLFTTDLLEDLCGGKACLGHVDFYNEPINVHGRESQHWVRTSCLFLPPAELAVVGSLRSVGDRALWFSDDPQAPFRHDAPLCHNFRRLITNWLTGSDIGQGVRWHSQLSLDQAGLKAFHQKATAVLNEHLLSLRLRDAGCSIVDVTWLAMQRGRGGKVDWDAPWYDQLASRIAQTGARVRTADSR
jgi:hypothetical protein